MEGSCWRQQPNDAGSHVRAYWLKNAIIPHEPWIRRKLRRMGVEPHAIEDVVQDAYIRLLNARDVSNVQNVRAYFAQTARSVVLSMARRDKCVHEETYEVEFFMQLEATDPNPHRVLEAKSEIARITQSLDGLCDRTKQVVRLRRFEQMSCDETARRLKISGSAVEKHLRSAMRHLGAARSISYFP